MCFYKLELMLLGDEKVKVVVLVKYRVCVDWKYGVAATEWKSLVKVMDLDVFMWMLWVLEVDLREVYDGMLNL